MIGSTISLSNEQKAAIRAGDGLVRVTSGAGTGKTTVLTHRAAWLVAQGIPPNRILALSFTKAAAREISQRAAALQPGSETIHGSTIHGLAARILRAFTDRMDIDPKWGIIDDDAAIPLLRRAMNDFLPTAYEMGFDLGAYSPSEGMDKAILTKLVHSGMEIIQSWKERMITAEMAIDHYASEDPLSSSSFFAQLYQRYQEEIRAANVLEIADLIPTAVSLLSKNHDLESMISTHFLNILVDEFQDVNIAQVSFLQILGGRRHMTIVGDDDQSIYMFRHSIPNAMRLAPKLLPEISSLALRDFSLTENRRSTANILEKANILVDFNARSAPKVLKSERPGHDPVAISFASDVHEAASIVKKIETLIEAGAEPKSIAILGRSASVINSITARLASRRVPHRVVSGMKFTERRQVRDLIAWARLAINPSCHISFARACSAPSCGIGQSALQTIRNCAESMGINYIDAIRHCVLNKFIKNGAGADKMADQIESLSILVDNGELKPSEFISEVLSTTQYLEWLNKSKDSSRQAQSIVKIFIDMAKSQEDGDPKYNIIKFLDDITLSEDPETEDHNAVTISSIHKSKGCEWDHVFVIGLENGLIPHHKSASVELGYSGEYDPWDDTEGCIEEERRILHVAMTRAKKSVILSMAKIRASNSIPQTPSPFIRDMEIKISGDHKNNKTPYQGQQYRQTRRRSAPIGFNQPQQDFDYNQELSF